MRKTPVRMHHRRRHDARGSVDGRSPRTGPGIPLDRAAARRGADDRLSARGPGLRRDVARLPRPPGVSGRVRGARLQPAGLWLLRSRPGPAAGCLHARRGAPGASRRPRTLPARGGHPLRPQRRRIDRGHLRRRPPGVRGPQGPRRLAPSPRPRGAARLRRGHLHRENRPNRRGIRDDAPAGAARALPRRQHRLDVSNVDGRVAQAGVCPVEHRRVLCRRSRARSWWCRAKTTSTARGRRSMPS